MYQLMGRRRGCWREANEAHRRAFSDRRAKHRARLPHIGGTDRLPGRKISFSFCLVLRSLHIRGVRAHEDTTVRFDDGVNVLIGPNGAGKTNILESIHMLCLSRSFLTSRDNVVLRRDAPFYQVVGEFDTEARGRQKVRVAYVPGEGKKIFVGASPLERLTDIVGRFPVVVFSPEDQRLTAEGPEYRRRFIDNIISQSSPVYLDHLLRYRQALKQRNELLHRSRRTRRPVDPVVLQGLTEGILEPGSAIIAARIQFVESFSRHLDRAYQRISEVAERPRMAYRPFRNDAGNAARAGAGNASRPDAGNVAHADAENATHADVNADSHEAAENRAVDKAGVFQAFAAELESLARREQDRGMTLCGPHRHDLDLHLDDLPVRRYASQGQHRTFGMALKLAQYDYMQDRGTERPILLLDDVFDNLDPARIEAFLSILGSDAIGQSVTTAARREIVHNHLDPGACRTIDVFPGGQVRQPDDSMHEETAESGSVSEVAGSTSENAPQEPDGPAHREQEAPSDAPIASSP